MKGQQLLNTRGCLNAVHGHFCTVSGHQAGKFGIAHGSMRRKKGDDARRIHLKKGTCAVPVLPDQEAVGIPLDAAGAGYLGPAQITGQSGAQPLLTLVAVTAEYRVKSSIRFFNGRDRLVAGSLHRAAISESRFAPVPI